ncbi:MAG: cell wall-binding repeat-containing protein, partial [Terrimesophilobacter sp.]
TQPNAVQRYASPYLASCNFNAMWDEAARKFLGSAASASQYFSLSGRHLVVLVDQSYSAANCGTGIGSVGGGSNGGGLIWANMSGPTDLHTIAHEFGHNLGLGHSNVHACDSDSRVEGTAAQGCNDYEYEDLYDVMSLAFDAGAYGNTNQLAALNVTSKVQLGVLPPGDLATFTGGASTVNLAPASDSSGVRGIKVTDSLTSDVYYIEYRSGTGMDSGAFYTRTFFAGAPSILADMRPGVRILRLRPATNGHAASAALAMLKQPGDPVKMLALKSGGTFASASGGFTVNFKGTSAGKAIVEISSHTLPSTIDRVSGADRFSTAVAVSQAAYPGGAPVVYVAQGANYPDALGAAPAAVKEGGPLLLTDSNTLTPVVKAEIERLNPSKIVVVGGTGVIKPAVFNEMKAIVGNTIRLGGANRYETARLVVRQAFSSSPVIYVATGGGFPDALSASAAAGAVGAPVILINGSLSTVDEATKSLIRSLGTTSIRIAGGTGVVSAGAANSLAAVASVTRSAGTDRFETNQLVNSQVFADAARVHLATGFQFPDALAGAAIAGAQNAPLYLVRTTCIPAQTRTDIIDGGANHVTLIGGTGVLTDSVKAFTRC